MGRALAWKPSTGSTVSKTESFGLEGTLDVPFAHGGSRAQRCEVIGAELLVGRQGLMV